MAGLIATLDAFEGTFDIMIDPEVGWMELQEIGIADLLEYNDRERYAYAKEMEPKVLKGMIIDIAQAVGIRDDETEVYDHVTGKTTKTYVDVESLENENSFLVTFWYDMGVGKIHNQGKLAMFFRPHSKEIMDRYDFMETKKRMWINKISEECKEEYPQGMDLDALNFFIKENDLLFIMEDIVFLGYDIMDFLNDVNKKILGRK